jgi:hypothetical protein
MTEELLARMRQLHQQIHRDNPPPANETERHIKLAMADMHRSLHKLILEHVGLKTLDLALLYHWLHIATLSRFITDPEFEVLAGKLDLVAGRLVATLNAMAAGIQDAGPSAPMAELGGMIQQARTIAQGLDSAAPLPHREVVRQSELTNTEIWLTVGDWLKKEINPAIIESVLFYHWLRISTIHANAPEPFFQKLERHWPEVMAKAGAVVDQLMPVTRSAAPDQPGEPSDR